MARIRRKPESYSDRILKVAKRSTKDLVDIAAMAKELDRSVITVRSWIREGALPQSLQPKRIGGRRKIYWTRSQIRGMKSFAKKRAARRGWQH